MEIRSIKSSLLMLSRSEKQAFEDICRKIISFMDSSYRNQNLENDIIRIYARRSVRPLRGRKFVPCFDLARIGINDESRGKGLCTQILLRIEDECEKRGFSVYVEQVLSRNLSRILQKMGYRYINCNGTKSFYKIFTTKEASGTIITSV